MQSILAPESHQCGRLSDSAGGSQPAAQRAGGAGRRRVARGAPQGGVRDWTGLLSAGSASISDVLQLGQVPI
jgi:hypothetical protein